MLSEITCVFPFAEIRCSLLTNPSLKVSAHFLACCLAYGHSNTTLNSFLHQNILQLMYGTRIHKAFRHLFSPF
jgi:hypothetical protein